MSHSNFKIIPNNEPINRNLVIIVNKNGDVRTDTVALQTLLTSKETPQTGVTVIRETSPTPSISEEIEEERLHQNELLREQYIAENPDASVEEVEQEMRKIAGYGDDDDVPHVTLNVENFYSPDQARKFANDVLHLGGIDNPQTLMPIDFNFRRQIIQNDHCYTPLTLSPEPSEKLHSKKNKDPNSQTKSKKEMKSAARARQITKENEDHDSSDSGEEDEDLDEEQSAEEEEISFSESDDDNDMDFSVNDRFGKKGKKKRKYRRHKQKHNMTFKDFLEGGDLSSMDEEPKKKYGKSPKKAAGTVSSSSSNISSRPSTSGKSIGPANSKNTQQNATKKVHQTFSKNSSHKKELPTVVVSTAASPISNPNRSNTTTSASTSIGHISIQSAAPTKSRQEIEFVESIVKDLEKSFPDNVKKIQTSTNTIPNIMQMMETNTPTEVIDQSLSTLEHMDAGDAAVGIEEIGDALIAVLGNEAIDELLNQGDLMNFDASQSSTSIKSSSSQNLVSSSSSSTLSTMQQTIHVVSPTISDTSLSPASLAQLPKILNKQAPIKDPIKVVRNGRVITLPPIEAPTTRGAKRRAQGDPITTSPPAGKIVKTEKTPSTKDPDSRNSSRRSSLNKSESGKSSRRQSTTQVGNPEEENDEMNSDASWNSEDDPDRLWCICKQPHNNRFMICCDKCEEWFHGTCVNVTKNMGKEMEKQDIKWHCPNCKTSAGSLVIKKDPNKKTLNQQKLTKFFSKNLKESTDEDVPKQSGAVVCVVCQKPARADSIYCSEECIRSHATKHLDDNSPKTPSTPTNKSNQEGKRGNVLKDQSGNVIVYDRVTGKLLSSKLWPHFTALGQWLSQNPNCEPVKPGSPHATQLMNSVSNKKNSQLHSPTSTTTHHHPTIKTQISIGDELFSNPVKITTGAKETTTSVTPTTSLKKSSTLQGQLHSANVRSNISMKNSSSTKPPLLKSTSVSSSSSTSSKTSTPKVQETKRLKRQESDEKPPSSSVVLKSNSSKSKLEFERMNVRSNLRSTLQQRMNEFEHPTISKMSEDEIDKFATSIESEMFIFFNKDTREKYKIKFRSLKFNLSDTKNKTIIEKICSKKLTPKQLVELPSSALASEELAKWRDNENKHQLEIITKSELDALAQNKIVLKTHKGEEIIETKTAPADISLPDEDVESVIAKTVLSVEDPHGRYDLSRSMSLNVSGSHSISSPLSSPSISSSTGRKSDSHHHSRSRSKSRGRDHHHHKSSSSSSKHKKNERHRSRSPKHSSHHSRDKSRDKPRDDKDHHSSKKSDDHKHHRDKSTSNEKDKRRSRSKDHQRESSKDSKRHHHHHHHHKEKDKDAKDKEIKDNKDLVKMEKIEIKPEQEDVDIVGKILDSMGVHLDTKPKEELKDVKSNEDIKSEVTSTEVTAVTSTDPISVEPINEHQLEIEIYSGNMYMADVTKFDVTASIVSGNVDDIIKLFTPQLEIVGRIEPKTVWDYLGKVKKLPGKELAVLRFASSDESAYFTLFSYLHSRQRYGVIKSPSSYIKDFYLITVEANRPLPSVLLPIVGPGFVEGDEHKPDLLLGVILKVLPESKHLHKKTSVVKKLAKTNKQPVEHIVPIQILPVKHKALHPHGSKLTIGLPDVGVESEDMKLSPKKTPSKDGDDDDDEPYTPFDEDSLSESPVFTASLSKTSVASSKLNTSDDLESQMEQLNREIEQRQMEIQTLAQQKALELNEEQATKIFEKISVPHNLSEILSTINASGSKPMEIDNDDDDDEEYIPMATISTSSHEYRPTSSYSNNIPTMQQPPIMNSMMDIDERINLFRQEMPSLIPSSSDEQPSRLASMSDADLMKLVPDGAFEAPPPPSISCEREPPIPGLEYEDMES